MHPSAVPAGRRPACPAPPPTVRLPHCAISLLRRLFAGAVLATFAVAPAAAQTVLKVGFGGHTGCDHVLSAANPNALQQAVDAIGAYGSGTIQLAGGQSRQPFDAQSKAGSRC